MLKEYIDLRVSLAQDPDKIPEAITRSEEIQNELWAKIEQVSTETKLGINHSLYIQSMNDLMSVLEKRVIVGLHYRIPGAIWFGLYALALLGMVLVGYQFGQSKHRQTLVSLVLALAFSSVIALIVDLDRASDGAITLNDQPIFEFQKKIEALPTLHPN